MKKNKYILGIIIIICALPFYWWVTYKSDLVESGSAYGVAIGSLKHKVFLDAQKYINSQAKYGKLVFTPLKLDSYKAQALNLTENTTYLIQYKFLPDDYELIKDQDSWKFYFGGSRNDSIKFTFCNDTLCKIYRHRQYFDAP